MLNIASAYFSTIFCISRRVECRDLAETPRRPCSSHMLSALRARAFSGRRCQAISVLRLNPSRPGNFRRGLSNDTQASATGSSKLEDDDNSEGLPAKSGVIPPLRSYSDGPGPLTRDGLAESLQGELLLAPLTKGGE